LPYQHLFFTSIEYGAPYHIVSGGRIELSKRVEVFLVCGIANPEPLKRYLHEECKTYDAMYFSDHYIFNIVDLKDIIKRFERMNAAEKIILTTEKDAVRLVKFQQELKDTPFYVLPIGIRFLFGDENRFNNLIVSFISDFTIKQDEEIKATL